MKRMTHASIATALAIAVLLSAVPPAFGQAAGAPCTLSVYVTSSKTQVAKDEKAALTATLSNSGDEACTSTTLSSTANPSTGATVTWAKTSVDVPAKGSADVSGTFSASADGSYSVTVTATRGAATANGSVTIGVGLAVCSWGWKFDVDKYFVDSSEPSKARVTLTNTGSKACDLTLSVVQPVDETTLKRTDGTFTCDKSSFSILAQGIATATCIFTAAKAGNHRSVVEVRKGAETSATGQGIVITVRPNVKLDDVPDMVTPGRSNVVILAATGSTNLPDGSIVKVILARRDTGVQVEEVGVFAGNGKFSYSNALGPGKYSLRAYSDWADCFNGRVTCYGGSKEFEVISREALSPSPTPTPTLPPRAEATFQVPLRPPQTEQTPTPVATPVPTTIPVPTPGFELLPALAALGLLALAIRKRR
jgi:hypothetical protein